MHGDGVGMGTDMAGWNGDRDTLRWGGDGDGDGDRKLSP